MPVIWSMSASSFPLSSGSSIRAARNRSRVAGVPRSWLTPDSTSARFSSWSRAVLRWLFTASTISFSSSGPSVSYRSGPPRRRLLRSRSAKRVKALEVSISTVNMIPAPTIASTAARSRRSCGAAWQSQTSGARSFNHGPSSQRANTIGSLQ